jgi:hypothetical protein
MYDRPLSGDTNGLDGSAVSIEIVIGIIRDASYKGGKHIVTSFGQRPQTGKISLRHGKMTIQ